MSDHIYKLAVVAALTDSIDLVVRRMAKKSHHVKHPGLAVVIDHDGILLGIITDGDIRRAYANDIGFDQPISLIMTNNPITIPVTLLESELVAEVIQRVQLDSRHNSEWVRHVLLTDDTGKLVNIIDFLDALQEQYGSVKNVAIFGMGYVGLTLAVSLSNRGHQVLGIDISKELVKQLNRGLSHVHELGISDMLVANIKRNKISFSLNIEDKLNQVYIVAVGTPLDSSGKPSMVALNEVLDTIGRRLKRGDQVMLRSTVPVGTTRDIVIPYLENSSNLKAGKDFYVSFAPERTVEGNAMHELSSLPQVVGGYSARCVKYAAEFWSTLTSSVVRMGSLEAAELVKLANNTFRDISFAFANELALVADRYNVDAFALINGANEGYSRNPIPLPSPGVGGYCLTKDPILFSTTATDGMREDAVLGVASRKVNEQAALYPIKILERYISKQSKDLSELTIVIVGVAFKGQPETTDMRGSVAVDIMHALKDRVGLLVAWDAVISSHDLEDAGFNVVDNLSGIVKNADAILMLNNHPDNVHSCLYQPSEDSRLLFDGWKQVDRIEIEKVSGLSYATMGYLTEL